MSARGTPGPGPGVAGPILTILCGAAVATLAVAYGASPAQGGSPGTPPGKTAAPTRADLDAARRRAALLETEHALARTRKPYVVVDVPARTLRYRMLGMDLRDVPCAGIEIKGLQRAGRAALAEPRLLAGVFSMKEKEDDPRLEPLTPEQIEAGLDDENTPNALPPEPPADFRLWFEEPVVARVSGGDGAGGAASWLSGLWKMFRGDGRKRPGGPALQIRIDLAAGLAPEVYRSLVPGTRFVVVPPAGWTLPDAGQAEAAKLRPGKTQAKPQPQPSPQEGVPFRLPPPEAVPNGPPAGGQPGPGDVAPPASPAPGVPPSEEPGQEGEEGTDEPDLPEDWVPAEEEPPPEEPPPGR